MTIQTINNDIDTILRKNIDNDGINYIPRIINLKHWPDQSTQDFYKSTCDKTSTIIFPNEISVDLIKSLLQYLNYEIKNKNSGPKFKHVCIIKPMRIFLIYIQKYPLENLNQLNLEFVSKYKESIIKANSQSYKLKVRFIHRLRKYINTYGYRDYFDNDLWNLKSFNIPLSRYNPSNPRSSLHFFQIQEKDNKILFKEYIRYLIFETNDSITTIMNIQTRIRKYICFLGKTLIVNSNLVYIEEYFSSLLDTTITGFTYNDILNSIQRFHNYLFDQGKSAFSFNCEQLRVRNLRKVHKNSAISKNTVQEIYRSLDKLSLQVRLMFIIIHNTGMRINELCTLEVDSFIRKGNFHFIRYYNYKFSSFVLNLIPYELYLIYKEFISSKLNTNTKSNYLFSNKFGENYSAPALRRKIKLEIAKLELSSNFVFAPHDLRHTIATLMHELGIPVQYIQKQLHHTSINMTSAYIDLSDSKMHIEINRVFNSPDIQREISTSLEFEKAKWLKSNINTQFLGNGFCIRSVKLGDCPNANKCLSCDMFLTDKSFLSIHEKQLFETHKLIKICERNGWEKQKNLNIKVENELISIIRRIEQKDQELNNE